MTEGWLYLAAVKDLYMKQMVGYSLNEHMTAKLVCDALNKAIRNQKPAKNLTVHSDRGSQYCSHEYRNIIEKCGFQGSMSKRGLAEYIPHLIMHRLKAFGAYSKMN